MGAFCDCINIYIYIYMNICTKIHLELLFAEILLSNDAYDELLLTSSDVCDEILWYINPKLSKDACDKSLLTYNEVCDETL